MKRKRSSNEALVVALFVCARVAEVAYREALYIGTNAITPKLVIGHTLKDDDEVADRA